MRINLTATFLAILLLTSAGTVEAKRPIRFEDLMEFQRLSDLQVSPDGRWVAFVVNEQNLENNDSQSHLWLVPYLGGEPKHLTRGQSSESRRTAVCGIKLYWTGWTQTSNLREDRGIVL